MQTHNLVGIRACPVCGLRHPALSPYCPTLYTGVTYHYFDCGVCGATFIDPVPDSDTLSDMYSKELYHDVFLDTDSTEVLSTVNWIAANLSSNLRILDYGCGNGSLLRELRNGGFLAFGVDFGSEVANSASVISGVDVCSLEDFNPDPIKHTFDALILRDVLEHLPNPYHELTNLLPTLKNEGLLFVEGPLEKNYSVVFLVSRAYRYIRNNLYPGRIASHAPFHLFFVNDHQQKAFFSRFDSLEIIRWELYETGWPYSNGGFLKRFVALIARLLSGIYIKGKPMGNRFRAVLSYKAVIRRN